MKEEKGRSGKEREKRRGGGTEQERKDREERSCGGTAKEREETFGRVRRKERQEIEKRREKLKGNI